MIIAIIVAGVIQAILPEAHRQLRINESDQPIVHPLIDTLNLEKGRLTAAAKPKPKVTPINAIYVGGRYIELSVA